MSVVQYAFHKWIFISNKLTLSAVEYAESKALQNSCCPDGFPKLLAFILNSGSRNCCESHLQCFLLKTWKLWVRWVDDLLGQRLLSS
jgi:hypothetical protein